MSANERLLVATATYNERENLPDLIEQLFNAIPEAHLLVVDDNSPDGTGQWVAAMAMRDPRISCLHRPYKLGLGSAHIAALAYAVTHRYAYVVSLDADGSHDPREIPRMLAQMYEPSLTPPDVIIGSRYTRGGSTRGWPFYRKWMSRMVNLLSRAMLGLPVRDCSGAFRCIRVTLLEHMDLTSIRSQGYACMEEILWRFTQAGARFEEIPIVFANRRRGTSKIDSCECLSTLCVVFRLALERWLASTASAFTAVMQYFHHTGSASLEVPQKDKGLGQDGCTE